METLMRQKHIPVLLVIIFSTTLFLLGCPDGKAEWREPSQDSRSDGSESTDETEQPNPYEIPEMLAKRVVLYRMAYQEGDLATFTAHPDSLEGLDIPAIARSLNGNWWNVDFGTAHFSPLPGQRITELELDFFQLIATRLDETGENEDWCLYTLGFDSDAVRLMIADAHDEWIPERRQVYLAGRERGCIQVWCVKTGIEWKVLAHLPCPSAIYEPDPPDVEFSHPFSPSTDDQENPQDE